MTSYVMSFSQVLTEFTKRDFTSSYNDFLNFTKFFTFLTIFFFSNEELFKFNNSSFYKKKTLCRVILAS